MTTNYSAAQRRTVALLTLCALALAAPLCATEIDDEPDNEFIEVESTTIMDAPEPAIDAKGGTDAAMVRHGKYMVELLGCGACHTDGALIGAPRTDRRLAGSRIGIAIDSPLDRKFPAVTYPANLTPDPATGLGQWSDTDIARAIRAGTDRHGRRLRAVMPWSGYARISDEDIAAIVAYLKSIPPVVHRVPAKVARGKRATEQYVYFGVYQDR